MDISRRAACISVQHGASVPRRADSAKHRYQFLNDTSQEIILRFLPILLCPAKQWDGKIGRYSVNTRDLTHERGVHDAKMSVSFYNRYVPPRPSKPEKQILNPDANSGEKRKREASKHESQKRLKNYARQTSGVSSNSVGAEGPQNSKHIKEHHKKSKKDEDKHSKDNDTHPALDAFKAIDSISNSKTSIHEPTNGTANEGTSGQPPDPIQPVPSHDSRQEKDVPDGKSVNGTGEKRKAPKREKRRKSEDQERASPDPAEEQSKKHSKILKKFSKYAQASAKPTSEQPIESHAQDITERQPRDFNSITLPEPDLTYAAPTSTDSALPAWLRKTKVVPSTAAVPFTSLSIAPPLLGILQKSDLITALPVQTGVLPHLLPTADQHPGDVCISAATGSGKTLSYILPILQDLAPTTPCKLRALIVVPTRELVDQVQHTLALFGSTSSLKVATASGSQTLASEQSSLVEKRQRPDPEGWQRYKAFLDSPAYDSDADSVSSSSSFKPEEDAFDLSEGHVPCFESRADVLITTPGRLVEHIQNTRGFTLSNLQWMVIDEADRLLDQSFQEWADVVNNALQKPSKDALKNPLADSGNPWSRTLLVSSIEHRARPRPKKVICSASMTRDLEKLGSLRLNNPISIVVQGGGKQRQIEGSLGEEEKIERSASGAMVLPSGLREYAVNVGDGSQKPLFLLKLLETLFAGETLQRILQQKRKKPSAATSTKIEGTPYDSDASSSDESSDSDASSSSSGPSSSATKHAKSPNTSSIPTQTTKHDPLILIFASTNTAVARLYSLLRHLSRPVYKLTTTLTKSTSPSKTRKLLASFTKPETQREAKRILIATDRASRGLDILHLTDVISYDVPHGLIPYVHRVGRTARAGREGRAWTLLERREAGWFWHHVAENKRRAQDEERIERAEGQKVRKVRLEDVREEGRVESYEAALEKLKEEVQGER